MNAWISHLSKWHFQLLELVALELRLQHRLVSVQLCSLHEVLAPLKVREGLRPCSSSKRLRMDLCLRLARLTIQDMGGCRAPAGCWGQECHGGFC